MTTSLVIQNMDQLRQFSNMAHQAGDLLPGHLRSPAHVGLVIAAGGELGLGPVESIRGIHLVKGKPVLDASVMLAIVGRNGVMVSYPQYTNEAVTVCLEREGRKPFECTWTMEDANRAGLTGNPTWKKFPRSMLRSRAVSEGIRAYCPDLLTAAYVPGELSADTTPEPPAIEGELVTEPAPPIVQQMPDTQPSRRPQTEERQAGDAMLAELARRREAGIPDDTDLRSLQDRLLVAVCDLVGDRICADKEKLRNRNAYLADQLDKGLPSDVIGRGCVWALWERPQDLTAGQIVAEVSKMRADDGTACRARIWRSGIATVEKFVRNLED